MPDGRSILLDRLPGADAAGYSGLRDRTNQHWGGMLRAASISTLLGVGNEVGDGSDNEGPLLARDCLKAVIPQSAQKLPILCIPLQ